MLNEITTCYWEYIVNGNVESIYVQENKRT